MTATPQTSLPGRSRLLAFVSLAGFFLTLGGALAEGFRGNTSGSNALALGMLPFLALFAGVNITVHRHGRPGGGPPSPAEIHARPSAPTAAEGPDRHSGRG